MDDTKVAANTDADPAPHPGQRGQSSLRVAVVGPQHPHTGGIANHTTELVAELRRYADVLPVSFRTLYPKCLYPGEYRAHVADGDGSSPHMLHYGNPLAWGRAVRRISDFAPDAVIIAWWTFFLSPATGFLAAALRRRKIPVYFICHNVFDHEGHPLKAMCARAVLRNATGCIVHASSEAKKLRTFVPAMPVLNTPLFCSSGEILPALKPYQPHAPLRLLFFGYVRPYKGLADLADALPLLKEGEYEVAVVGEWWAEQKELRRKLEQAPVPVTLANQFVSDDDKRRWFEWADAVVLPYRSATASGVVADAYNFGKPVITTAVGGIPEVVAEGKTGFLASPATPSSLAAAIDRFRQAAASSTDFTPHLSTMRQSLGVENYTQKLLGFITSNGTTGSQTPGIR